MKAIALVVSARKQGNCFDFARFTLDRLQTAGIETELINFSEQRITPCQGCEYQCIQHVDKTKGVDVPCPIDDDVRSIWEKTWAAEILCIFIPNYGGLPPALWFAFSQRSQAFYRQAPLEKIKKSVVSAVVIAPPHQSSGAPWVYSLMGDEVKGLDRKVAGFEVINPTEFGIEYTFNPL
ncbi:MAG TPA: NAD(P)H-dependent oxidoreductase, partial [Leptolinea sp.]